ncbi:uncharacterized protein DS421_4g127710 [Arachis hypogaea]|nr:uncharacterized protein DS421_4g127710 [Arachis hypogaea]
MPPSSDGPLFLYYRTLLCCVLKFVSPPRSSFVAFLRFVPPLHRCRHSSRSFSLTTQSHCTVQPRASRSTVQDTASQCCHPTFVTQKIAAPSSVPSLTVSFISFILLYFFWLWLL